jgi:hypothetical protein
MFAMVAASCTKYGSYLPTGQSGTLGGSTDIPINTIGNTFAVIGLKINNDWANVNTSIKITDSKDGVNTVKIFADLGSDPNLASINRIIPAALKDAQGRISFDAKVKITSEGWLDYSNVDGEPVVLVKYNDNEGTRYEVTTSSGTEISREITHKSTTDDFEYGFFNIKVMKVEQETSFPGFKKYVGYFNHKFGLVGFELVADDGSTLSSEISAAIY